MSTLLTLALALSLPASANSSGKTGKSTTGCTTCHGTSADSNVTATLSASDTEVDRLPNRPGQKKASSRQVAPKVGPGR